MVLQYDLIETRIEALTLDRHGAGTPENRVLTHCPHLGKWLTHWPVVCKALGERLGCGILQL